MSLFKNLSGYRWSLYVVQNENHLVYAMHENSVIRILGYVMRYFSDNHKPIPPWDLVLNFNKAHKSIKLKPEHFTSDGGNVTKLLISEIEALDPGYQVKGAEPVFEDAGTKKRIPVGSRLSRGIDLQKMIDDLGKPKEITFFDIMDDVFGKR